MKKIMSLVLALALVLSMGVTVFADEATVGDSTDTIPANSNTVNVTANYVPGENVSAGTKYLVNVSWTVSGTLTYKDKTNTYTWNTTDMRYEHTDTAEAGTWSGSASVDLTVTNKSNADISVQCSDVTKPTGLNMTAHFDKQTFDVATAAPADVTDTSVQKAVPVTAKLTISDVSGAITAENTIVASFTVTISAKGK